jgi:hypothetical protein
MEILEERIGRRGRFRGPNSICGSWSIDGILEEWVWRSDEQDSKMGVEKACSVQ